MAKGGLEEGWEPGDLPNETVQSRILTEHCLHQLGQQRPEAQLFTLSRPQPETQRRPVPSRQAWSETN